MRIQPPVSAREISVNSPRYTIIPIVQTPKVNPGEEVEIELQISGYGKVERNKLHLTHNQPNVIDENEAGEISFLIGGSVDQANNELTEFVAGEDALENIDDVEENLRDAAYSAELTQGGVTIIVNEVGFVDDPDWDLPEIEYDLPRTVLERTYNGLNPVKFKYNISNNANPGDYSIFATFTYYDGENINQSHKEITFHINNKREQLEPYYSYALVTGGVTALISLLADAGFIDWVVQLIVSG